MLAVAARLRSLPADVLTALAFFSRVPVKPQPTAFDLRRTAGAWPIAGFLLAIGPAVLMLSALVLGIPPMIAALTALASMAALTGGMHEDGLADTADGFGGGATRADKLAVMRDSRLGTFGALALLFAVLAKVAALGSIAVNPNRAVVAILCVAVLSRAFALWHWSTTRPARPDGMAAEAGQPDIEARLVAGIAGLLAMLALAATFRLSALLALLLAVAAVSLFSRVAVRQIGGHTGDTIGAAQQIAETLLFVGLAANTTSALG